MIDCLIIGFNDSEFESYVEMIRSMGKDSGAYRDLDLAFIEYAGKPHRSIDILNRFYFEDSGEAHKKFHNADFLWPVVTYLSTYLSSRGFSFDYVNLFHLEKDKLKDKLRENDYLTIAITTTLYVSPHPILEIISFIKEHNDTAKIVVGGPYISNQPKLTDSADLQRLFKYLGADVYVISSEGELALVNLIRALKNRSSLDDVDNISYLDGDTYITTSASIESNPLEENMVNYTLFPREEIGEFVTLRTAKSCPFSCSFCGFPQRAGKYKYMGVDLVEKELNDINEIGTVTTLTFIDDTFNVPKERFKEILRMMIRNDYGFKWNSFYRSDHGDEETIELMARAGCEGVFLGIESGSNKMLKLMNKTARREDYLKSIPLLKAAGISTHANVIVGFPGETYETVQETFDLLEETKPDFFRAQLWYADPVTPIWNKREEYGVNGSSFNWSHNTMDYQTACDLVDKMFVGIEESIWLPQYGFEQWSTFYLQRKGMKMEQIKSFLKCFNSAIKDKLIHPHKKELDPHLIESLRASCKFNQQIEPDMAAVERLRGANYIAAEQFWVNEVSETPASNLEMVRENVHSVKDEWTIVPCPVEREVLDSVESSYAELSVAMLAAYSALLLRLNGREDTMIVTSICSAGAEGALPLRLSPRWTRSFSEFVQQTQQKIERASDHRTHAFYILTNPLRLAEYGASTPLFDVGYTYSELESDRAEKCLEEVWELYPPVKDQMGMVLHINKDSDDVRVRFAYRSNWFRPEIIQRLVTYFVSLLREVGHNSSALLGQIPLSNEPGSQNVATDTLAREVFHF